MEAEKIRTIETVGAIFSFNRAGWSLSMVAFGDRKDFLQFLRIVHFRSKCTMRKNCNSSRRRGHRNSTQIKGSVLETCQSRLHNALSKVLDEPVASRPAGHLEARFKVGLEVPSRQDDEFFRFPGHVEGCESLVCNRQVIPRCNDHEQRS